MASSAIPQLEHLIEEVLKSGDVQVLDVFLKDADEKAPIKCSQKFVTKLDKFVTKSLDKKDAKAASLAFATLYKCGKLLKQSGGAEGLPGLITQGLVKKWFEKCKQLWVQCGPNWDETLFTLSENFFSALMEVHEACKEGTYKITESLLYPVGQLAVDSRIYILIQKEAIRKYNLILDKIPVDFKKKRNILTSQEASRIMTKLAGCVLEGGDYDLQSSQMEALCRMATPDQRKELADRWFSMGHVASAFTQISDSEFETACRRFLNMVNGMQGDKRRVYSYPCLEVYLDKYELLMPSDEKLEEFWIDFNLGSHSISFYFSLSNEEEGHWETICICENEVQSYTVTESSVSSEDRKRQVLRIKLSEVVVVGAVEGSTLAIHFSSSLDILQAARNVFGHHKNKHTSVANVEVKTATTGCSTQVVPESQVSLGESEKNTAPYISCAQAAPAQMATPARLRVFESTVFICSSGGGTVHSGTSLASKLSNKDRDKTPLGKFCTHKTTNKTCGESTTLSSKNTVTIKGKKTSEAVREDLVFGGKGEEKSPEPHFVPDTQHRSGQNTSSCWNKFSVSEMLMMPTQKMGSLPRSEPHSNFPEEPERCPSSAQKESLPDSSLVFQKKLHSELTLRLQHVLNDRNQDPSPQEAALRQKKTSSTAKSLNARSSGHPCGSSLSTPRVQQARRNDHTKNESKGQMSLDADAVPLKASVKTSKTRSMQERQKTELKSETKMALPSKEKRDAEISGSTTNLIPRSNDINNQSTGKDTSKNSAQNWICPLVNRPIFNMSWLSSDKKRTSGPVTLTKSNNKTKSNSVRQREDIFTFNIDTSFIIGGGTKTFPKTSVLSINSNHNSTTHLSTTKKAQCLEKNKRYVKKHLFSDTDTDNATTEVSWLRESSRKPKPEVTKYSRQAFIKPKADLPDSSYESPELLPPSWKGVTGNKKPRKRNTNLKKVPDQPKKAVDQLEMVKGAAASKASGKRPRRAAATSMKYYMESDTDDSPYDSENQKLPAPKMCSVVQKGGRRKTCSEVPQRKKKNNLSPDSYRKQNVNLSSLKKQNDLELWPRNVLQEPAKLKKKNVFPAQEQRSSFNDFLADGQNSFLPLIEKMRSAERSAPTLNMIGSTALSPRGSPLPASPMPPCHDTPSPILLLPKPRSTVSSKGKCKPSSFYSTEKKYGSSKSQSMKYVPSSCSLGGQSLSPSPPTGHSATEMCSVQRHLSAAPQPPSSLTQPLLTSTLLELNKPPVTSASQSPFPEDTIGQQYDLEFSKVSSASLVSLSQSSSKSSGLGESYKDTSTAALIMSLETEKTPVIDGDLEHTEHLVSGPSRKHHFSMSDNSEEDEKEKKRSNVKRQRSPRMKPRKLFKSSVEAPAVDELSQVASSSHTSYRQFKSEVADEDVDMDEHLETPEISANPRKLCQQFSSELKKKFQRRFKMMEVYNKQSSKTMQHHVSSISVQLNKYRTQRLEQVKKVLKEEIQKMEQDDKVLKCMEKDLTVYWKKQTVAFRSHLKQETVRNEILRKTLQTDACDSLEYEEEIFKSEMCLIKKDMKSVQDRLLNEMLEGEIQNVKRGLHTLFFP